MKNKWRFFAVTLAVVLCMTVFSVTAYAGGGDMVDSTMGDPTMETPTATTQPENTNTGEQIPNEQTLTVLVTENADGSHTVTIGDRSWTLPAKREQSGKVVNVRTYLNLRTGPGTDYTVIGRLLNGAEVKVLEESNGWYKVVVPEQTGYVYGKYLEVMNAPTENSGSDTDMAGLPELLLQYYAAAGGSAPLTPDGNLTLMDDIGSAFGAGKQFITVTTKGGNTFYLIIDRDDKGNENVHFLNLVDEADLLALTKDGESIVPACTCTDKCAVGKINTGCKVCRTNMSECAGKEVTEPTPQPAEPAETAPEKSAGGAGLVVVILLLLLGGGGALYWFKLRKKAFEYFIRQKIVKAVEAGCGDAEALLRTPKPVKSIYYDFKYYFDEYSYANCDLYVEKAIEDCGNNTLRKEFLRAKGWDAPDDFDINDEEE